MPSLSPTSLHVPPPTPMTNARVSMFEGATNTNIINSNFTITNGNGQQIGHSRGLEMLLEHCCLGARLDSNERFDPPRCAEDTRVAITQHIMDWIASADDDGASMLVLHGSAGAGKSALEQSISERCQREGYLGAAFFLSRTATSAQRSNGDTVIPTIVYQLIQIFPWLRHLVLREIEDDPSIFQLSRAGIMHRLFIKYFKDHFAQFPGDTYKRPCLIAIDGLDECSDCDVQCDLLKIIASAVHDVPYPFRFFVACRPESHLMAALSKELSVRSGRIRVFDLGQDESVHIDMRTFLVSEFRHIRETHPAGQTLPPSWPTEQHIATLVARASGQFVFLHTAIKFVGSPKHRPPDRLDVILNLLPPEGDEKPFAQLDALYFYIFSRVERFDKLWPILGILVLLSAEAIEGLNESQFRDFASPSFIERVCMFEPGDVSLALDPLASLVSVPAQDHSIKILHASLFDFLLDPSRSGIYQLRLVRAHECLAKWRWRQIDFGMTQEMEDEAIWLFLKHCEEADLRDSLVEMIGRVATFLVGFLDTRDEKWWLHSTRIGNYELLVGRLSLIFLREDFPHGTVSSDFVCAVAEKWNQPASLGMSERFVRTLEPRLEAPEWNAQNGSWDRSFHRVVRQLRDLRPSRGQSTTSSKSFPEQNISSIPGFLSGPRAVEHARELAKFPRQMPDSRSRDVQRAFMAMRLLFWTQRFLRDTSGLAFPRVATRWVLEATYALDLTGPSSDAALVLFVLSLLPYLPGTRVGPELHEEIRRRMKVLRERTALDYTMQEPIKEWALGLRAFPKITANYRREAAAYLKRTRPVKKSEQLEEMHIQITVDTISRAI